MNAVGKTIRDSQDRGWYEVIMDEESYQSVSHILDRYAATTPWRNSPYTFYRHRTDSTWRDRDTTPVAEHHVAAATELLGEPPW